MHELKELSSFHWVCWRDFCAQPPCCLRGAGPTTAHHRFTYLTGFLPRGPGDLRCGAYFRWKNLGGFVSQISKRNIFKEQMPSSGSLKCRSQLRNQSIPFYWKKKNCYQVVSVVLDALSAQAKRTKLLSAFSSRKRVAFVLIWNLYMALRLLSNHLKI